MHPQAAVWWAADAFGISLVWSGQQGFILLTLIESFRSALFSKLLGDRLAYLTSACFAMQNLYF